MSREQVATEYEQLLAKRRQRIEADKPKTWWSRLIEKGIARYYPMPLLPIDDDFRLKENL